jgi:hypothetical protein
MRKSWATCGAVIVLLSGAGNTFAQNSPTAATVPAALAQPRPAPASVTEQPIVRMRTAGQPDRQLKVLRVTAYTEGESVAEVQDVQTGQTFTLPGKVVAMLPKEAANEASIVSTVRQATHAVQPSPLEMCIAKPPQDEQPTPTVVYTEPKVIYIKAADPKAKLAPVSEPRDEVAPLEWRPRLEEAPAISPVKLDRWMPMKRFSNPTSSK